MTFRVGLHYVRPDNYHVFMSCDVVELGLSSMELDSRLGEICRDSFVLLRAYSFGIASTFGVIIGLIGTTIVEFARDPLELGNIWRKVHRELNYGWKHRRVKEGKRTLKTKITKLLNELAAELSTKTRNKLRKMSRQNYRTSTSDAMICWSCSTRLKLCTEKISMHRWQLQQAMKRIDRGITSSAFLIAK